MKEHLRPQQEQHGPQNQIQKPHEPDEDDSRPKSLGRQIPSETTVEDTHKLHSLIRNLNEQAMNSLYAQCQQNVSKDLGGGRLEYLVIQRRLSEMLNTALVKPDGRGENFSDIEKAIITLERAENILKVQRDN